MFELVKSQNMEISDGSISAQEWGKTLDKLAELQQKRTENNVKAIYCGAVNAKIDMTTLLSMPVK